MSITSTPITPQLQSYLVEYGVREPVALARLRARAASLPEREMMSGPEVANLVAMMVGVIGARKVIEVGVFVGYTTAAMALAMPAGGRILACDVSKDFTDLGKAAWSEAGVSDHIELHLAPALETLDGLIAAGNGGTIDLIFIDADKSNYGRYYERAMQLLRVGGLVLIDNVFWGGKVIDAKDQSEDTRVIRALNQRIRSDERGHAAMVPIGDGLTVVRKLRD